MLYFRLVSLALSLHDHRTQALSMLPDTWPMMMMKGPARLAGEVKPGGVVKEQETEAEASAREAINEASVAVQAALSQEDTKLAAEKFGNVVGLTLPQFIKVKPVSVVEDGRPGDEKNLRGWARLIDEGLAGRLSKSVTAYEGLLAFRRGLGVVTDEDATFLGTLDRQDSAFCKIFLRAVQESAKWDGEDFSSGAGQEGEKKGHGAEGTPPSAK